MSDRDARVMANLHSNASQAMAQLALVVFALAPFVLHAEAVNVKYRGTVDLAPFDCAAIDRSSFIDRLCYDAREQYVLVSLSGTFYHYCEVPNGVVAAWRRADSMGSFYNSVIKGKFDCRVNRMPAYR